ncbi:DUF1254 domain-containing protein [Aequorivita sp. SDUM287046]|uniref:DUF1254 domain-containing protein n=1 Tax=Aequorivita aurantiaca TaxID=3053356 RepID=A0ABT8DJP9_9FLAO|nr:DUF1254 domain-containing protein [Aequorivita aurantiaca]MDN3724204.1 DUF1254 domain-containing protein [Aequorivita aurantiaca]
MTKQTLLLFFSLLVIVGCKNENRKDGAEASASTLTPSEAQSIAKDAYIFAYPMIMGYQAMYFTMVDESSPGYRGDFNSFTHDTSPADYTRTDVVTMNADTPYSLTAMDLRAEPMVISVPEIKDRYYVIQFIDLFTHNFAFIGTRATGTEAGDYLFVGPNWKGDIPEGKFKKVFKSESELVTTIGRTQLLGKSDLPNVIAVQKKLKATPLSTFLGKDTPEKAPKLDWIKLNPVDLTNENFIDYYNFLLALVTPFNDEDKAQLKEFEKIGIAPGKKFDASEYSPEVLAAIKAGVQEGTAEIKAKAGNIAEQINGWNMMDAFGSRSFYKGDHVLRAAAAMVGIYANDKIEAFYPMGYVDKNGEVLNGENKYQIHFKKDEIPPAKYFWSITLYNKKADGVGGYLVQNELDRYLINSTSEGLIYDKDGGFTVYIQNEKPRVDKVANWLPAPKEPFYLCLRIYGPKESAMDGTWKPPYIEKVIQ